MPSVGEQLRSAREAQGKSLEDIGSELKIRVDHVTALEAGDFDKFDAPIFVRGFVRSYCRILKLDTNALVVQLNQELGGTETLSTDPALPGKRGFVDGLTLFLSRLNWSVWLPLIVVVCIAAIVLLVVNTTQAQEDELNRGDWINALPETQYTPVRTNVLSLELQIPSAPVKPPSTNTPGG
ncbi:MAG: hypothetical protein CMO63_00335 [Verrucomicrobiales bacterium]|nr:hypothetical protein [Verrucomicrobiales bacterium]